MKHLVVKCHAGLGNRIRALVAARRVAKKLGRELSVIWPIDGYHCGCAYQCLFKTPQVLVNDIGWSALEEEYCVLKVPNIIRQSDADLILVTEENFFWTEEDELSGSTMWGQHAPSFMKNEAVRGEILNEFANLVPNDFVSVEVDRFHREKMEGKRVMALHIRREDNEWSNTNCSDTHFLNQAKIFLSQSPGSRVLLSTDGRESRELIMRHLGSSVIEYPVRSLDRGGNWRAVQDAFITMLLMAKCDVIARSPSSTFSQCAAWFGNKPTIEVGPLQHDW
jgi:hypothetical protein